MRLSVKLAGVAFAGGLLAAGPAQAAFFTNGSFEQGTPPPATGFTRLPVGSTAITGWTVLDNSGTNNFLGLPGVDYVDNGFWRASDGTRSVDLSAILAGGLRQTFDTTPGTPYVVTFDLSGNPDDLGDLLVPVKTMTVEATGNPVAQYTYNTVLAGNSPADMRYVRGLSYAFTATGTSTDLTFRSLSNNPFGPVLDNVAVAVAPVPAPATALLAVAGVPAVGLARRLRRPAA